MSTSVPLEFDDEVSRDITPDVPDRDDELDSRGSSRGGIESGASASMPATSSTRWMMRMYWIMNLMHGMGGALKTRLQWKKLRFDDIPVVGVLDEDQELEGKRIRERKHSLMLVENLNMKRNLKGRGRQHI